ncbi:hypothetical protein LTR95_000300 [Oleoguttula sp. CCFEE 5521]
MPPPATIDALLNLAADSPTAVISHLRSDPTLASAQDSHGYSLLHAAASYAHLDLARALVNDFSVSPNITDEDGETALFNAETVEVATVLVELGVDLSIRNEDSQTAAEKLADEDESPAVAAYLRSLGSASESGVNGSASAAEAPQSFPPLPNGVHVNVGTMQADEVGGEPDAEFRRRIEELAARGDFEGEAGQRELRSLIEDARNNINNEGETRGSDLMWHDRHEHERSVG